jgi:Tfp pilus assembly protein PilX
MDVRHEDGIAMMMAMAATLLLSALGVALVLATSSEAVIASNFRDATEGGYAADAALERALDDLRAAKDWNAVLTGVARSSFVDGAPSGTRTLADGSTIDLARVVNLADCGTIQPCSDADMNAVTPQRPWGPNNPRWQLYAYGNLSDVLPSQTIDSPYYVIVMVGDDPSETDGKPLEDGIETAGAGILAMRAEAFAPRGAHRSVEMTVARPGAGQPGLRVLSWREVR